MPGLEQFPSYTAPSESRYSQFCPKMGFKHIFLQRLGILKLGIFLLSLLTLYHIYRHSPTYPVISRGLSPKIAVQAPIPRNFAVEVESKDIQWDQYKYLQIVSTIHELCSAVMVWKQIEDMGSRAGRFVFALPLFQIQYLIERNRIMLYPSNWPPPSLPTPPQPSNTTAHNTTSSPRESENEVIARLLLHASKESFVSLLPYSSQDNPNPQLQAFNLTSCKRILLLGPAAISVLGQLDEIFLAPSKAEENGVFVPHTEIETTEGDFLEGVMLLYPSTKAFTKVTQAAQNESLNNPTILDIIRAVFSTNEIGRLNTTLYGFHTSSLLVHPPPSSPSYFSPSYLLSPKVLSHFTSLKSNPLNQTPSPLTLLKQTKIIHFSPPPLSLLPLSLKDKGIPLSQFLTQPWVKPTQKELNTFMPPCKRNEQGFGASDCEERRVWMGFWEGYRSRRKGVCGFDFVGREEGV